MLAIELVSAYNDLENSGEYGTHPLVRHACEEGVRDVLRVCEQVGCLTQVCQEQGGILLKTQQTSISRNM